MGTLSILSLTYYVFGLMLLLVKLALLWKSIQQEKKLAKTLDSLNKLIGSKQLDK